MKRWGDEEVVEIFEQVLARKMKIFPMGFWKNRGGKHRAAIVTRYLVEEKLRMQPEELPGQFGIREFRQHKLDGMMVTLFRGSPYLCLENAYPGKFRPWDFDQKGMWKGKKGLKLAGKATRWLIEEKLKIPVKDIPKRISFNTFQDYGLRGMMKMFGDSPFVAIENAYPGKISWEDMRHSIRADQKYVSNHGHVHRSMFERDIDNWLWEHGVRDHAHDVKYPGSNLNCDIVVETNRKQHLGPRGKIKGQVRSGTSTPRRGLSTRTRRVWIECAGMMQHLKYRKTIAEKRRIAKKHGLKLIIIYPEDTIRDIEKKLATVVKS